jgi:uncharacterized membrane protein YeaQ/YmgE (transglycosylase-associated protein family)
MFMVTSLFGWIVRGLVAGFIARRIMKGRGGGIVLGVIGAIASAWRMAIPASRGLSSRRQT